MNKVVFVQAKLKNTDSDLSAKKGFWGTVFEKVEDKKRLYKSEEVDGEQLVSEISIAINELNSSGYEVISISPITSGAYDFSYKKSHSNMGVIQSGAYGYGYGFSYTEGVIILARESSSPLKT